MTPLENGPRLDVVVLTSGMIGVEVAARLAGHPAVATVSLITAPAVPGGDRLFPKLRRIHRYDGTQGLVHAAVKRLARLLYLIPRFRLADAIAGRCPGVRHLHFSDFHDRACLEHLRASAPHLGVVADTYRLLPAVFSIPRMGCVNLHLGKLPEFRGASPGFYELLEGVDEVGVTIHRVTGALDGGSILRQETFPLDLGPEGDPLEYLRRYQAEVLVANGARMMAETVAGLARGDQGEQPQAPSRARPRRRATWARKRELRRVVAQRRAGSN
ncbi:MAG: formyltransferase family protein, partial [Gemmatimonadales bacterium]